MPLGWETHSAPELSGRPQELINERVLKHADLLVGIFWTRIGTPTGKNISGTIEEIEEHRKAGKPVMLYFSEAKVEATNIDPEQFKSLQEFKTWAKGEGLIQTFKSPEDFAEQFRRHLQLTLQENYLKADGAHGASEAAERTRTGPPTSTPPSVALQRIFRAAAPSSTELSEDSKQLLLAAADADGVIMVLRHLGGTNVSAGGKEFAKESDKRSVARWSAAVEDLYRLGLTRDINGKREIFELNNRGFEAVDQLKGAS